MEVADDLSSVLVGGRSYPARIVAAGPTRVELEIAGEKVVVDDWPDHFATPPGPVAVDGERFTVSVSIERSVHGSVPTPRTGRAPAHPPDSAAEPSGEGVPVTPPMPGRVVELRAREGDRVTRGEILLVLEAMKMRNEIPSPASGIVRRVRVAPGANVRSKETMLYVVPD